MPIWDIQSSNTILVTWTELIESVARIRIFVHNGGIIDIPNNISTQCGEEEQQAMSVTNNQHNEIENYLWTGG